MIWIWDIIVTYGYAFDKKIVYCWDHRTKLVAWIFPTHGVSCMNWNTRRVICLINEWENEDSIRLDATHLCKIYLCYSGIVFVRLKYIILTHTEEEIKHYFEYISLHSNRNLLFYNLFSENIMQLILGKNVWAGA